MTSDVDESSTTAAYWLSCTDCTFETTVQGSSLEALTVAGEHQQENGDAPADHFVNFERQSSSP